MSSDPVADLFRSWGYLQADLDPLGRLPPLPHAELDAAKGEAAERWRAIYCGPIGVEFMHMLEPDRRAWIAARMEGEAAPVDARRILRRLAAAELFERFLHQRYVGTKRYSLEGSAALVPLLDAILIQGADSGVKVAILAMSHRGRLNVMLHVIGVEAAALLAGFQDVDPKSILGGGDVKYHQGATGDYRTPSGHTVQMHLVSNPSHLEAVDPVLAGRVRARQERLGEPGREQVLGILVHGDAAFAGQGIAAETLNLAGLAGFSVGGTLHIVVNNLIGFTAEPPALHSSRFATDVARRLSIPILHVNGEDPDAVERAGRLALDYRAAFASDVVVDLIGYRRHGHSEVDDPTTTQPLLYRRIAERPRLWPSYARRTGVGAEEMEQIEKETLAALEAELERARAMSERPVLRTMPPHWEPYLGGPYRPDLEIETAVAAARIEEIARAITTLPRGFTPHPKVAKGLEQRLEMGLGRRPIDWGTAEALAFGSLAWDGMLVRLAGQDSRRGTFNQRHAVLVDHETGAEHVPLAHLHPRQGRFDVHDTPLSEAAALGFEYGFSRDYPDALVCWEAQFGDFANGAQIILDQFVSAAEDKWGLLSGLVILLPHGYEGQGPEHSSARLERHLQLAAEDNLQVTQPTTSAQYFHLLRRQALRLWRKPLVVATPKGLLRSPAAASDLAALTSGSFTPVLDDAAVGDARRVLLCSGRVAHDLDDERARRALGDAVAIVRLEQLYPFPATELGQALERHGGGAEVIWVQEEPANMGALAFVRPLIERLLGDRHLTTVKRSASASPATGSPKAHAIEQKALLEAAFARLG